MEDQIKDIKNKIALQKRKLRSTEERILNLDQQKGFIYDSYLRLKNNLENDIIEL